MSKKTKVFLATFVFTAIGALLIVNLSLGDKPIDKRVVAEYSVADPQFLRTIGSLLGPPIVGGNRVVALYNGDEIFPAMLDAIRNAKRTINFETYIYWQGRIGKEFADRLSERARAGVKVKVILDWVGSGKIDDSYLEEMRNAGVEIRRYHPVRWYTLSRLNNRTHRKLLIVDGRIGFTGGVGIADEWTGRAQDKDHWRDTHFRIEGPGVSYMQGAFMDHWIQETGTVLSSDDYFPPLPAVGEHAAQVFNSSPHAGGETVQLMYLLSIAAARKSILISMSYFLPDDLAVRSLIAARKRGVRIQVVVPGANSDVEVVRAASRSKWGDLLRAGVEIYEYQPTMYHCKVMIVDELWTLVGSTNFDNRSFVLNDETNLNIYDPEFARAQAVAFLRDVSRSKRITLEQWESRPWTEKLWENSIGLLESQL